MVIADSYSSKLLASGQNKTIVLVGLNPASPTHSYSTMFADGKYVHFARLVYTVFYV